jgi:hypothetical protein
LGSSAFCA